MVQIMKMGHKWVLEAKIGLNKQFWGGNGPKSGILKSNFALYLKNSMHKDCKIGTKCFCHVPYWPKVPFNTKNGI